MWMNILKDDYYEKRVAEAIESALKEIHGAKVFVTLDLDPKWKDEYLLGITSIGKDIETQVNKNVILKRYVRISATYSFEESKFEEFRFWVFVSRWSKTMRGWDDRRLWNEEYDLTHRNYDLNDLVEISKELVDVAKQKIRTDTPDLDFKSQEYNAAIQRVFWKGFTVEQGH
jgi:hypothetical protein